MRPPSPRRQAIKIRTDIGVGQVQHLAPKPPVLLDLRRGFRRPSRQLPMRVAGLRDPAHGRLERRVLKLEMNPQPRAEVRVAIGDHVDALHGRDRLDIFQAHVRGVLVQLQGAVQKAAVIQTPPRSGKAARNPPKRAPAESQTRPLAAMLAFR